MDEKHGFQSEDLVEATSAMPGCTCPLCMSLVPRGPTVSNAPPVPEGSHIGDQRIVDPQLTDYEFSGYDGEVMVVLRSRHMKPQATRLLIFSNPHALDMLIRALQSVLSAHTHSKAFVEAVGKDDRLMSLREASADTGIPISALADAILLGKLPAYPMIDMNTPVFGKYMVKVCEIPVSLTAAVDAAEAEVR